MRRVFCASQPGHRATTRLVESNGDAIPAYNHLEERGAEEVCVLVRICLRVRACEGGEVVSAGCERKVSLAFRRRPHTAPACFH